MRTFFAERGVNFFKKEQEKRKKKKERKENEKRPRPTESSKKKNKKFIDPVKKIRSKTKNEGRKLPKTTKIFLLRRVR